MKYIILTRGFKTTVDDEDYDELSKHKWMISSNGYAVRGIYHKTLRGLHRQQLGMHRAILKPSSNMYVDHINGNKLDNCRTNLRLASFSQNGANKRVAINSSSGIKGVRWHKGKWEAQIETKINGKRKSYYLGRSSDIKEAAHMYNEAALKLFKEYAKQNES